MTVKVIPNNGDESVEYPDGTEMGVNSDSELLIYSADNKVISIWGQHTWRNADLIQEDK